MSRVAVDLPAHSSPWIPVDPVDLTSAWDESAHPRDTKGKPTGGRFIKASSGGSKAKDGAAKKLGCKGGDLSTDCVKRFQKRNDLKVDGVVGKQTATKLRTGEKVGTGTLDHGDRSYLAKPGKAHGTKKRKAKKFTLFSEDGRGAVELAAEHMAAAARRRDAEQAVAAWEGRPVRPDADSDPVQLSSTDPAAEIRRQAEQAAAGWA